MSGQGAPRLQLRGAEHLTVAVVASLWHERVMAGLVDGCIRVLDEAGVVNQHLLRVPGAFELPLAALRAADSVDAVVALGVVIRGGTPHFEYVCNAATSGLLRVSLDTKTPVGFGLLTCDDEAQALDRAGLVDSTEDKGAEAASAALSLAIELRDLNVDR